MNDIYKREPIEIRQNINIFSAVDEYTENYEVISENIESVDSNPWMEDKFWSEMEKSSIDLLDKVSMISSNLEKKKLLDVGVGTGRLIKKIERKFNNTFSFYGLDISMHHLTSLRDEDIEVCFSKIEDMPYKENLFDVITCTDVLEHVFDLNLCVTKILHVLKPDGLMIVRVPNKENLNEYTKDHYPFEFAHLRNFDRDSLFLLFSKIFRCEILGFSYGPSEMNFSMSRYNIPILNKFFNLTCFVINKILMILSKDLSQKFLNNLYHPSCISVAIRKNN